MVFKSKPRTDVTSSEEVDGRSDCRTRITMKKTQGMSLCLMVELLSFALAVCACGGGLGSDAMVDPSPAPSAEVVYMGVTDAMWAEIETQRKVFGDPNDCRSRVAGIPVSGTTISACGGNCINNALAGSNTVILKGGKYTISNMVDLVGKKLLGAPGEDVVIDATNVDEALRVGNGSVLSNLRVLDAGNIAVNFVGNNNLIYRVSAGRTGLSSRINSSGSGFAVHFGTANNCLVSTEAFDSYNEDGAGCAVCAHGGNANGYSLTFGANNNTLIDSHAYRNSDDGIDFWEGGAGFVYFSSAFDSGKTTGKAGADGNGVKLGRGNVRHYFYKTKAYNNLANGFDINGNTVQPLLILSDAFGNGGIDYKGVMN